MIILKNISKSYGPKQLFKDLSYNCPSQERIALVGNNGMGKTTLLNVLCGFEHDYDGELIIPESVRLGYLPQIMSPLHEDSIIEEALAGAKELNTIIAERDKLLANMEADHSPEVLERYDYLEQRFNALDGYRIEEDAIEILLGLGFVEDQLLNPVDSLSGGWRMRLEFAKMLLNRPNFLILDEPTNHLDLPSIEWFENYLKQFKGTILFVSHDKDLLNRLATHILHLRGGELTPYKGNFDAFLEAFTLKQEQNTSMAKQIERQYQHIQKTVDRFRYKASKAKMVQDRLKTLTKLNVMRESMEFETLDGTMQLKLTPVIQPGRVVAHAKDISVGYSTEKPLIKHLSLTIERGWRIAILGKNGLGKTTLLKTLLGNIAPLAGECHLGHNVVPGYFAQEGIDGLDTEKTIMENINRVSPEAQEHQLRSLLGSLGLSGDDVFKKVGVLSGGEKSRIALACLLAKKPNVLFLDEPTNHLDLYACENLANALCDYEGTVIFVSHNRAFIHEVATHTIHLKEGEKIRLEEVIV